MDKEAFFEIDNLTADKAHKRIQEELAAKGRNGCGSCTQCCTTMRVEMAPLDLPSKPEHKPCQFLCKKGCSIYDNKPESCTAFICLWLATQLFDAPLPRRMRPDKCKVVMDANSKGYIVAHCATPNAWRDSAVYDALLFYASRTKVLIVLSNGKRLLMHSDGSTEPLIACGEAENGELLYRTYTLEERLQYGQR